MIQDTPARIERNKRDLSDDEMIHYMQVYFENHDIGLTLNGLLLLHKPAGIQDSSFYVHLASGATARIRYRLKHDIVVFQIADTGQEFQQDQLFSLHQTTPAEFINRAYAFVDGEARSFEDIRLDLQVRAKRRIVKTLMQIDGVLSVMFLRGKVVVIRDPKKPNPHLTRVQREMFRDGKVVCEEFEGEYKDDFARGDQC
jgi:hypothetical protein